eukprot:s968_g6.t1
MSTKTGAASSDENKNNLWNLLPSFDPSVDDIREYAQKIRFLHGVCPQGQRGMLAPRLAMLCKGTAWNQVRSIPAAKLTDAENGVSSLLEALSSWEESEEMVTFEKFERALHKVLQKNDESTMSYTNRLNVAFDDLGENVKVQDVKAFILLRQSCLNSEDKKKVLTMTGGKMDTKAIDQAMRSLATRVLTGSNEPKKRVYPTNFVEEDHHESSESQALEPAWHAISQYDDDWDDSEMVEHYASLGDADALAVQSFESDLEDLFQSTPDLQQALVSYQEARLKLAEKKRYRGFWPTGGGKNFSGKGKGKSKKGGFKGGSKGSLLDRISRTHCKLCGEKGHWRAECPNRTKESANVALSMSAVAETDEESQHVIVESFVDGVGPLEDACLNSSKFASVHPCLFACDANHKFGVNRNRHNNGVSWKEQAISFLSQRLKQRSSESPAVSLSKAEVSAPDEMQSALHVAMDGSHAVLDTGASRSVIGSELVPSLLKDLPTSIRSQVKQLPSSVGFKFGNNQVSYSHSQLRIPMIGPKKKIWLLIEVVKGHTPFLMSIHAMKCLGAQIDLGSNQVFLQTLQRTMTIHENNNGLFMVRLKDLCTYQPDMTACAESIFHSQLLPVSESPTHSPDTDPICQNAEPSGDDSDHQGHIGASHGEPQSPAVLVGESCRSSQHVSASPRGKIGANDAFAVGSSLSEEQDRRDLSHVAQLSESSPQHPTNCNEQCGVRSRVGGSIPGDVCGTTKSTQPSCEKPACDLSAPITEHASQFSSDCESRATADRCREPEHRVLGAEVYQLGPQMARSSISRGVREGSKLCAVDQGQDKFSDTTDARFPSVLPVQAAARESSIDEDACSSLVQQDPYELLISTFLTDSFEQSMIAETLKSVQPKGQIDLLEVYTEPNSRLSQAVESMGGKALRFTREDGDLSTRSGQIKLLRWVFEYSPKHLWLSPDCLPWCAWARFNKSRSISSWLAIHGKQEDARVHLAFCSLLMKIQRDAQRHTHMENPDTSEAWEQPELHDLVQGTIVARFDQCQMGLKHPQNHKFLRKRTAVRTTSHEMHKLLDERFCTGQHVHAQIAGSCKFRGKSVPVSRFAAFYPSGLAKRIARCILKSTHTMVDCPIFHVEELTEIDKRPLKRIRTHEQSPVVVNQPEVADTPSSSHKRGKGKGVKKDNKGHFQKNQTAESEHPWAPVFQQMRRSLPRVGAREFRAGDPEFHMCQQLCPQMTIQLVKACKGVEKFMTGDPNSSIRHTVIMKRFTNEIEDLGSESVTDMSLNSQRRRAGPCHVMICMFGQSRDVSSSSQVPREQPEMPGETSTSDEVPELPVSPPIPLQSVMPPAHIQESDRVVSPDRSVGAIQPWTPAPVSQSGPKFEKLSQADKALIRKMHHNLGHPTAEKLSKHLAYQEARSEIIAGAKDYQCSSCVERRPPKQGVPGALKSSTEFNEVVGIDGFEWSNNHISVYVLHAVDDVTKFHLGKRTVRDSNLAQKSFTDFWMTWAGSPQCLYFDAAGEFLAQPWQSFLQSEGIQHKLTATAWQRGQVERHGGIVKEMLSRMNHEKEITSTAEFDQCLQQCFRAKNSLTSVNGYSPEQCVLGKATKLPASVASDSDSPSHLLAEDPSSQGEQFRITLQRRQAAREAFVKTENSQAIRRAILRKSQGEIINWQTGQLCMYWSKRDAPNMLEQGRWVGPAQIVLQESRSIVWVSYLIRLLRCARENLRPVSLREYQNLGLQNDPANNLALEQRARELSQQLRDRIGTFQYRDLSALDGPPPDRESESHVESNANPHVNRQPEEEPARRDSNVPMPPVQLLPHEIPIPDTPLGSEIGENDETNNSNDHGSENGHADTAEYSPSYAPENEEPSAEVAGVIYNASLIEPALDGGDCIVADDETIWRDQDNPPEDCCSFEFFVPVQQLQQFRHKPKEALALIASAAKKSHTEVTYQNLTTEEKALFDVAKKKELKCWLDTNTVRSIMKSKVHPSRIMGSRWVLTWKICDQSPNGYKPKARLVVKGYQDPLVGQVQTDSPTLSRDARMVLLQTVSSMRWRLQNFDIKTAFLRGRSDGRQLAMQPVPELRSMMGLSDSEVCLLEGNAYGRVDAPLLFYKELRSQLEKLQFEAHPLDNCLFLLRNQANPEELDGILGCHVDDGIGGGNKRYEEALSQLQKVLPFGSREYGKFRFTGLDLEQLPDYSIKISQGEYVQKIPSIEIPKFRRSEKDSPVTAKEVQELRALCGSLQYAAVHSRPDIATKVAYIQKAIPKATVSDLMEANKVLREAKEFSHTSLFVRPLPFRELTFASFGDASFASESNLKAQQGLFVMACTPAPSENKTSDFSPIAWATKQIGRVVRSTLSAEAYAMSSSIDKLNWIRSMWGVIQSPKFQWQFPEISLKGLPKALLVTDCKSLFDLMTKVATPNCQEWRTTIEVMLIKEQANGNTDCRTVLNLGRF